MTLPRFTHAAVAALWLAGSPLANAHAHPQHETPAEGATVAASPHDVAIDFDHAIEPAFSSLAVTDAHGTAVTRGRYTVDASNPKHMSVELDTLAPGVYTVAWVAVSADGHRTHGHYTFTVK